MRPIEFKHVTPNGTEFETTVEFLGDTIVIYQDNEDYDDETSDTVVIDIHKMKELIAAYEAYRSSATE